MIYEVYSKPVDPAAADHEEDAASTPVAAKRSTHNPSDRVPTLRGPSERLKYDLRRVWECPACHHRERTGGDVTYRLCECQRKVELSDRVWMKLIDEGGRVAPELSTIKSPDDAGSAQPE